MLLVDTTPTLHGSPALFRLESVIDWPEFKLEALAAITDLSAKKTEIQGLNRSKKLGESLFFSKEEEENQKLCLNQNWTSEKYQ